MSALTCERCGATQNVERSDDLEVTLCGGCFGRRADGAQLAQALEEIEAFVCRYVVLEPEQACAVTLFVAHTHAFNAAQATPYLAITSAEKRSGKTRLLEVLATVVARPWFTGGTSKAALVRKIDNSTPTLLLDESDAAFSGDREYSEALRGVLNTGYRQGGNYTVCIGQGSKIEAKDFTTYCPKAIAGIGELPDTVADRSIPIRLKRRRNGERVERFRMRSTDPAGAEVAARIEAALAPFMEELFEATPSLPEALDDRGQDVWEPLLAIADCAGPEWAERARRAASTLNGAGEPDEETLGIRLLSDCRRAFGNEDRITSKDLLAYLHGIEDGPWADWYGKPMTARKVSELLRRFEIRVKAIRVGDSTPRGYLRQAFEDAWDRYLPPSNRNSRNSGLDKREAGDSEAQLPEAQLRIDNGHKPLEQGDVAGVADSEGVLGEDGLDAALVDPDLRALTADAERVERGARALGLTAYDDDPGVLR